MQNQNNQLHENESKIKQALIWNEQGLCMHCGGKKSFLGNCKICRKSQFDCPICGNDGCLESDNLLVGHYCSNCRVQISPFSIEGGDLKVYEWALFNLEIEGYYVAQYLFQRLGQFKDSEEMAKECERLIEKDEREHPERMEKLMQILGDEPSMRPRL